MFFINQLYHPVVQNPLTKSNFVITTDVSVTPLPPVGSTIFITHNSTATLILSNAGDEIATHS